MQKPPGPVEIRFISGYDLNAEPAPRFVRDAGLMQRFAVIQETYTEGAIDPVFDEALWRALADYVARYGALTTMTRGRDLDHCERTLPQYLAEWANIAPDDRDPPEFLLARTDGALELCAVTEFWVHVGGPKAYHDTLTYVLYSKHDVSSDLVAFLRAQPGVEGWVLTPIQQASPTRPPFWRRLFSGP